MYNRGATNESVAKFQNVFQIVIKNIEYTNEFTSYIFIYWGRDKQQQMITVKGG